MIPYDHVRGYLHTRTVKWSYGAITGRETNIWQQSVSLLPVQDMLDVLVYSGFHGIYLDRMGFVDNGQQIIQEFSRVLGQSAIHSEGGRKLFFLLDPYAKKKKRQMPHEVWKTQQRKVLNNPLSLRGQNLFQPSMVMKMPVGFVEVVQQRAGESRSRVLVGGWAVDPETRTPAKKLMVVHEGRASQLFVSQQVPRPDIARRFGAETALKSQWSVVLDTSTWAPGKHSFEIYSVLDEGRLGRLGGCGDKCRVTLSAK